MVQIDVNGKSSFKQRAQEAQRRYTESPEFAAAEKARSAREKQESNAWLKHQRSEESYFRRMDALYQKEIRLHESRLVAEQRLQHRYRLLEHRAGSPLTPSSWNAWQRAHSTLSFQARLHQQKFGTAPFSADSLRSLRTSTGTEESAFRVGRTLTHLIHVHSRDSLAGVV